MVVDQATERAGSLQFLLERSEAMIDVLREERKLTARVRSAGAVAWDEGGDDKEDLFIQRAA